MHLGKYFSRRLLLGLGALGTAAAIACSASANSSDEYITSGQPFGNSGYIFQDLYEDGGVVRRHTDVYGQDYGPVGYAIGPQGKEFLVLVGAVFPEGDKLYCITRIETEPPEVHYTKITDQADCSFLPQQKTPKPKIGAV